MPEVTKTAPDALREHLAVCNDLLALAQKESEALKSPAPVPMGEIQAQRKALLSRLEASQRGLSEHRARLQGQAPGNGSGPEFPELLQAAQDTIMRVLVLSRENEEQLLRRGLLPARALPPPEQSQPNYIAQLYRHHAQS